MYITEYNVRNEQNKDLVRQAEKERLIRQIRPQRNETILNNARNTVGRGLVRLGETILNER
ncbi:MAG: hypothetical protein AAF846_26110 [Chloroflexota bacterium]